MVQPLPNEGEFGPATYKFEARTRLSKVKAQLHENCDEWLILDVDGLHNPLLNDRFSFLYIFIAIKQVKELTATSLHTDLELFRRIAHEDAEAYRLFFDIHFQQLYAVMLQFTGRKPDAEDIVQSVFLKVWEKRRELLGIDHPRNWLFINARNEFLNRFRKNRTEQQYRDYLAEIFEEEMEAPDHLLVIKQRNSLIRQALKSLPEKQQQAFLLSREEGLTYEKIAQTMGIARTTVKEHISRAMKTIRDFVVSNRGELLSIIMLSLFP